jgi:uncharacterized protein (TIGR00297 family)
MVVGALVHGFGGFRASAALIAFFVTGSVLSRRRRQRSEVAGKKGARRDATQVLANGGVAAATLCVPSWSNAGAGAIAAACADTWATELGAFSPSRPRSVITGESVAPGTSGGMTVLGSLAAVAGAALIGAIWAALGDSRHRLRSALGITIAGVAGCFADSLAGATIQAAYHCDTCDRASEDAVDGLGHACRLTRGARWVTNDTVNLVATLTGALVARGVVPR